LASSNGFAEELQTAVRALSRRDGILRPVIKKYGACRLEKHTRYFDTLAGSIISQQLSTKAADTIRARFVALYPPAKRLDPALIKDTPDADLRAVGLSGQKAAYIKDLAAKTHDKTLRLDRISKMADDEVIEMLTHVKGIGVWTVHMFMIFSLGRLNVLPVGDLGIRKGIQNLYGFDHLPTPAEIEEVAAANNWAPYCSVASWYLWRSLENKPQD
jgi:DNA-3-methyladenine glycosylase II